MGKQVQPSTYKSRSETAWPQHHNMWAKYAQGRHLPGSRTISACALRAPGTSEILQTAAWEALDLTHPLGEGGDTLLRRLRPSVQEAVFDKSLRRGRYQRRSSQLRPLRLLEGEADLDGIAALVVLLREAHEAGNAARAFNIGRSLHSALLMATNRTPLFYIALELFDFFISEVFPLAADEEIAFDLHRDELSEQLLLFSRTALQLEDQEKIGLVDDGPTLEWRKVLSYHFGFDLHFGLGPRFRLTKPPEEASKDARNFVSEMAIYRDWGLSALRSGIPQRLIPEEVEKKIRSIRILEP
ncbi:hypothetical protein [Lysobacter sp. Root559]|uniref:hypothetical protein n=1 Tax=Lysobacter sp. Root559 TaxID=1736559 RepID=UPI0012FCEF2B|nr:hypothetical protein [Lysobacter sp. Root559]